MFEKLVQQSPGVYILPAEKGMKVPGLIIANETLLKEMDSDKSFEQVRNVAYLEGIVGHSIAMPDLHWGYGFPIGGVAATDAETGVISPGGVGYDINCGVRLAVIDRPFKDISDKQRRELLEALFKLIPSGIGKQGTKNRLTDRDYKELAEKGARWSIEKGYGFEIDLDHMESQGVIEGADSRRVSDQAKERGAHQLGSIGSGNHFVEIGEIETIYLPEIAKAWRIHPGQTYALIHSGSRGFGHQICQDALNDFVKQGYEKNLPDKQLIAAPINSELGCSYFQAMAVAANFAFNNRQHILTLVRQSFQHVLKIDPVDVRLVYDVCHNIAKFETYEINGSQRRLCVHRKGATRAFGAGNQELAPIFRTTGQPVIVPGDMGRASFLMVGLGNQLTWNSACHGAGRARSRTQSLKAWQGKDPISYMRQEGVLVMAESTRTIAEEMPDAYKDVDVVIDAVQTAGLANKVARLKPKLVVKG